MISALSHSLSMSKVNEMPGLMTSFLALAHRVSLRTASANSQPAQVSRSTIAYRANDPDPSAYCAFSKLAEAKAARRVGVLV